MMKMTENKWLLVLFVMGMLTFAVNAQTTTRKGFYNAHMGDSIGPNRTTKDKAILDCYGMSLNNPEGLEIYYTMPERVIVDFPVSQVVTPVEVPQFQINSITESEKTETSIRLDIEFNRDDLKSVYIRFRSIGGIWQRTTEDPGDVHWIGLLDPATEYEYMVYAENSEGVRINSDLLTFNTK